ncbi:hypothetical protein IW261DRAFT_641491 [Armillaria novae-zelandiae]|uniref:SH3 domain-containing protein n=1 Tax=Armillaria novae-zelandiae TaxID=153914 RepID=A0AA39PRA5_9AGAR|nr:hypothetical protein IW261DRAFT_641491 [Armillaria novae-zelandiae]
MHISARSTHIRRTHPAVPAYSLTQRAPALINLPVSLPDIPIVSPIVTLLVAGINQQGGASTVTVTTTVSTLAASATESSNSASNDSSSGNSSGSGSTDSSSDSANSSDSSSASIVSVSDVDDVSDSTGSGSSGVSGGGSLASTGSVSAGGGSESSTEISATASGSPTGATSIVTFASNGLNSLMNTFIFSSSFIPSSGTGSIEGTTLPSSTRSSGVITPSDTAASTRVISKADPSATDDIGVFTSSAVSQPTPNLNILSGDLGAGSTAFATSTNGVNGGTGGTEGGGGSSSNGNGTDGGGLPTGATVVISLIVPAIFAASLLFFIRQRFRAKRNKRNKWWFSNMKSRGDDNQASGSGAEATAIARSIRSSFGTPYEYNASWTSTPSFDVPVPVLPPMAEIRRSSHSPELPMHNRADGRGSPPLLVNVDLPQAGISDVSLYSTRSTSSELYRQYLISGTDDREPTTPASVRPPAFVFPRSPQDSSNETTPKRDSGVLGSSYDANPFADSSASSDHQSIPLSDVEIIRRPFEPTLHDEISVSVGDHVQVLKVFNDGWALVEKIAVELPSGKGKQSLPQAGLIPIDCLRDAWQPLPAFLEDKGVSGYSETGIAL